MWYSLIYAGCTSFHDCFFILRKSPIKAKFIGRPADKYIAGVDGQDTCTNIVFVATDGML